MEKSKSAKKQKFKPAINVGTTSMKKAKSTYPGRKEISNLAGTSKKTPPAAKNSHLDFQSQLTYLSKQNSRRSSRKSTKKAVTYAHPQKQKQIEVGVTCTSPYNREESNTEQDQ